MTFSFSHKSIANMEGVHPELVMVFNEAIKDSPIDFGIPSTGGVRSVEAQHNLFLDGKSKCDGYKRISRHQLRPGESHGTALDFYAYVDGSASWKKHHLAMAAGVIMATAKRLKREGKISIELYWGGQFGGASFDGWDYPHFEVAS